MRRSPSRTSVTEPRTHAPRALRPWVAARGWLAPWARAAAGLMLTAAAAGAAAQSVALSGTFGERALLVIDGKPKTLGIGEQTGGVRLVGLASGEAVVEVGGKRVTLALGASPVSVGSSGAAPGGGSRIVLTADGAGHFWGTGAINGKSVRFMVDTGATAIGIGQAEADRLGIDYKNGEHGLSGTANGAVPVYHVSLATVRVGDVQLYDVPATILPSQMPFVLLGNSFLNRFQMRRENDKLTLDRRW